MSDKGAGDNAGFLCLDAAAGLGALTDEGAFADQGVGPDRCRLGPPAPVSTPHQSMWIDKTSQRTAPGIAQVIPPMPSRTAISVKFKQEWNYRDSDPNWAQTDQ
ncbi:MAG: hypothetical protein F4Y67_10290 [Chloroflexi bacterium]|nr:hypothetical protein [Chloroflexota bacterium]